MQHRQQALPQMRLTRPHGVSDIPGATGMAIIKAIVAGERDPQPLATLRHPHGHHDAADIAQAWQGPWRAVHLLA